MKDWHVVLWWIQRNIEWVLVIALLFVCAAVALSGCARPPEIMEESTPTPKVETKAEIVDLPGMTFEQANPEHGPCGKCRGWKQNITVEK